MAVLKTDIQKLSFNRTVFADDGDFLSFQKELLAHPLYHDPAFIPGADHRLLTLVTCSYEWDNAVSYTHLDVYKRQALQAGRERRHRQCGGSHRKAAGRRPSGGERCLSLIHI